MKIITHFEKPVKKDIFFYEVQLDPFDENYFIEKIEEGVRHENNNNYKTSLSGQMTSFEFFLNDKPLELILKEFLRQIKFERPWGIKLVEAWGIKLVKNDFTNFHDHIERSYSGILYLSKSTTPLIFPELNKKIYPEKYKMLFFNAFLLHGSDRLKDEKKYGIAYNFALNKHYLPT